MNIKCDNCNASKEIKDTFGCYGDRVHNAWEDLKHEFFKIFKYDYQPQYQCRYADLVAHPTEKGGDE